MMTSTELSAEFAKLRVHQQEGHGAVYKPLLALLMLGRHFAGTPFAHHAFSLIMGEYAQGAGTKKVRWCTATCNTRRRSASRTS